MNDQAEFWSALNALDQGEKQNHNILNADSKCEVAYDIVHNSKVQTRAKIAGCIVICVTVIDEWTATYKVHTTTHWKICNALPHVIQEIQQRHHRKFLFLGK